MSIRKTLSKARSRVKQSSTAWLENADRLKRIIAEALGESTLVELVTMKRNGHRRVAIVETPERGRLVVHVALRTGFIRILDAMHRILHTHAIPTPPLLAAEYGVDAMRRYRCNWAVFRYVDGNPLLRDCDDGALRCAAEMIGRLHGITPPPDLQETRGRTQPAIHADATLDSMTSLWRNALADHPHCDVAMAWLLKHSSFLQDDDNALRGLVHGDLRPANVLLTPSGETHLLDLETIHAGHPGVELSRMAFTWAAKDRKRANLIFDTYCAQTAPDWRRVWTDHASFFLAAGQLQEAVRARESADRYARTHQPDPKRLTFRRTESAAALERFKRIVACDPDGKADAVSLVESIAC